MTLRRLLLVLGALVVLAAWASQLEVRVDAGIIGGHLGIGSTVR